MAEQQQIEWVKRDVLRGFAVDTLVFPLFGAAWMGATAGTLSTTPVETALTFSEVGLLAVGGGW